MEKIDRFGLRTWIEIDTKAIRVNYRIFRKFIPGNVRLVGVVKSNAYGHDIIEFAQELENLGIDMLAVDSITEALSLRRSGIQTPILVLGYTLPEMFSRAIGKDIHLTISSISGLRVFLKYSHAKKIPIHLKIDTGMHRQGFLLHEVPATVQALWGAKGRVYVAGLYTHFAEAKDPDDRTFTEEQIAKLVLWKDAIQSAGFIPLVHAGATAGALIFPEAHFDMVRVGIGLYGVWPSGEIARAFRGEITFKPVLSWKTIISEVKGVLRGEAVGYNLTYRLTRPSRIAVCPIGYWHGFPRALSNNAFVLVRGERAPVLGCISMDMIVVDVTDIPGVKMGDEAVLIGQSGKEKITVDELACSAGTTSYEILTRLNPLMRRVYR